jgi:GAF domain-containing protein
MSETQKITALFFLLPSEFNDAKSYEMLLICQTKCVNLQALKYFAMEKEEKYKLLKQQIEALVAGEDDSVSVMANVSAAIHQEMGFFWTGFYIVKGDELHLGPFQGSVACMHIPFGRGVCGTAWQRAETIVVPDVEQFPGHIACSSLSRSEIVVPLFNASHDVVAVLDIDSRELNTFDDIDRDWLEQIVRVVMV